MDLSVKEAEHFGLEPDEYPFGDTPVSVDAIYRWRQFDDVVDRIVEAVLSHKFLVVVGNYCSSKSTAWQVAEEELNKSKVRSKFDSNNVLIAHPAGLDPRSFSETTVYRAIVHTMGDGEPLRRCIEDRATQCQSILQGNVDRKTANCFLVNDAQGCRPDFLLVCKRLWDQLYGFNRLTSVVLIGQMPLARAVQQIGEINARKEMALLPGLGKWLPDYLRHEVRRCGGRYDRVFSDCAVDELRSLSKRRKSETEDHPYRVNCVVIRAMRIAKRVCDKRVTGAHIERALKGLGDVLGDDDAQAKQLHKLKR